MELDDEKDRELVAALLRNDGAAWEQMLADVARPLVETRKYREMTARFGLAVEDILAQLCEELYRDDFARLRAFRYDGSFAAGGSIGKCGMPFAISSGALQRPARRPSTRRRSLPSATRSCRLRIRRLTPCARRGSCLCASGARIPLARTRFC